MKTTLSKLTIVLALASTATIAIGAATETKTENQPAPLLLLVPVEVANPGMQSGCWAQMYDERNFKGEMLTIVGPMQIDAVDKSGGRELRKSMDSLVTGPKTKLVLYEQKMFKDKSVEFGPNSKEAGLVKKLGFRGRIESMRIDCTG